MELQEALFLIEQYVEKCAESELGGVYERASGDMFSWLRESGCSAADLGKACRIIEQVTGHHPSRIRNSQDAELLKAAIYGSWNAEAIGKDTQKKYPQGNKVQQALQAVRRGFFRPGS